MRRRNNGSGPAPCGPTSGAAGGSASASPRSGATPNITRTAGGAGFRPKGIIATAMVLHDWERQTIQSVFGRPVTNRYGCEEVSLIACECERHHGLHVNADSVLVETIRDGRPARLGT